MDIIRTPDQILRQYITAKRPIVYINHFDFEAVDRSIQNAAGAFAKRGFKIIEFTEADGWVDFETKNPKSSSDNDLANFLQKINTDQFKNEKKELIVVLKEVHDSLQDKRVYSALQAIARRKSMAKDVPGDYYRVTVIIVDSRLIIPREIEKLITIVDIRPPSPEEIEKILRDVAEADDGEIEESAMKELVMALNGLSEFEIIQITKLALANDGVIDKDDLNLIFEEKRQAIQKSGLLELYYVPKGGSDQKKDIGDFDNLLEYLDGKARIFKNLADAKEHGVDSPAGIMLVGMPGCGKSLSVKAVADKFGCPALKMDIGRLLGKYVGESEENLRRAIQVAEVASPCILWIDDIEKAFAGASGGEVMTRMFGYFLTWMQEKTAPVYVLATANNISGLPPEFTRRGRFDEIFKVDLPKGNGIADIFRIHVKKRSGQDLSDDIDFDYLAKKCNGKLYSGADIASMVKSAAEIAYLDSDGPRQIDQDDLEDLIRNTTSSCKAQENNESYRRMVDALEKLESKPVSKNQ